MNRLARPGRSGTAWGAWIKLPGLESTEMIAGLGYDFCVIDLEHTLLDLGDVLGHLAVGSANGARMLVRIPDRTPALIQRLLDAGADGLVVPHVDSAADAAQLVSSTRFPPEGTRGSGATSRAGRWGSRPRAEYLAESPVVVAQIESVAAVEQAGEIAGTDGITALMLGPADLELDRRSRADRRTSAELSEQVLRAARANGTLVGTACAPRAAGDVVQAGYDFAVCVADSTLLMNAADTALATLTSLGASSLAHQETEQ